MALSKQFVQETQSNVNVPSPKKVTATQFGWGITVSIHFELFPEG